MAKSKGKPDPPRAKKSAKAKKPMPKKPVKSPPKKAPGKSKPTPTPPPKTKPTPSTKPAPRPVRPTPKPMPTLAPRPASSPPTPAKQPDGERDRLAGLSRQRSETRREAGPPPDIANPDRREACSKSLKLFCETYAPEAFAMGWSDDHLRSLARIQEAATLGARYAMAEARGNGKTTRCRLAALWATLNAICRYAFVIGATDAKATETLDALQTLIRFSDLLAADYPEVSHYARALNGIANRSSGQTCNGVSTMIEWSSDGIVFPTVPPPPNWPKRWPLRPDGMVPTSGVVIATSGLTGEGIRGSLRTLTTGEMVRPDFVLLDDPQTSVSARSKTQNLAREQLISADILGMAGPGKKISAVMPCTVIEPGDMVDRMLDRKKHPLWRGERSGILKSMPKNLLAWDAYYDEYSRCAQLEPPDLTESTAYYVAHQVELEEGAEASWKSRKFPEDVSAIQHAMHLRFSDPFAFAAEYMNDPKPLHAITAMVLDAEMIARKVTNLPRWKAPRSITRVTAFIDVGAHVLWYVVVGWDEKFGGSVLDYGPYPDQSRVYFASADARPMLSDLPGMSKVPQEATIFAGLTKVAARILDRKYVQEDTGTELSVERCLVDANWGPGTELVYEFCRRDPHTSRLLPSHGKYIGPKATPINAWQKREENEQKGPGWRISTAEQGKRGRKVVFDTNKFKTFVAERFRTLPAAPGCLQLFQATEAEHQMFADHCSAEYPKPKPANPAGYDVDEWVERIGRDNHLWDCVVGCAVAASIQGLRWDSGSVVGAAPPPKKKPKKVIDIEKMYREAHPEEVW